MNGLRMLVPGLLFQLPDPGLFAAEHLTSEFAGAAEFAVFDNDPIVQFRTTDPWVHASEHQTAGAAIAAESAVLDQVAGVQLFTRDPRLLSSEHQVPANASHAVLSAGLRQ